MDYKNTYICLIVTWTNPPCEYWSWSQLIGAATSLDAVSSTCFVQAEPVKCSSVHTGDTKAWGGEHQFIWCHLQQCLPSRRLSLSSAGWLTCLSSPCQRRIAGERASQQRRPPLPPTPLLHTESCGAAPRSLQPAWRSYNLFTMCWNRAINLLAYNLISLAFSRNPHKLLAPPLTALLNQSA